MPMFTETSHLTDGKNDQVHIHSFLTQGAWKDKLWKWVDAHLLSLRAAYLPGCGNTTTDVLSHSEPVLREWQIRKEMVQLIWNTHVNRSVCEQAHNSLSNVVHGHSRDIEALGQDTLADN